MSLTCQVDGPPADPVRERPKDNVTHQEPGEEQRSSQADLVGLLLDEKPLGNTKTDRVKLRHAEEEARSIRGRTSVTMVSTSSVKTTRWGSSCCCGSIRYSGVDPIRTISMD